MSVQAFIAAARSYVGTPFHHGGRLPGVGLDCIGVVVCAALVAGAKPRDVSAYPLRPNGQLPRELAAQLDHIADARKMVPGDVLLMRWREDVEPHHLAIFAGETLIHAYASVRKCVEQPMVQAWRERLVGAYRFREFA